MTTAVELSALGRRYRSLWALRDCYLALPEGAVVALVGPNGAGKSTLLNLTAGLLRPTEGTVRVFGAPMADEPAMLAQVAFMAQDTGLYPTFTATDLRTLGRRLNPGWDDGWAGDRLRRLGVPPDVAAARLSGGQRAQLALVLALAKRPRLLLLDEPLANLDPVARHEIMATLMEQVADGGLTVVVDGAGMAPDAGGVFEKNDRRGVLLDLNYRTSDGRELTSGAAGEYCADPQSTYPTPQCLDRTDLRQVITYQPLSRYPWFQLIETALLLVISGAVVLVIRRRITHRLG
ncbi:ABC transporter ATP-binding protein [Plantactinospora sonchi]|uniref:ABC transporter ATP-binding protein n=1 Tax=Plantactinospora sonchi TaxID=1544735 RepID=A0ABU7RND3_9ACTN